MCGQRFVVQCAGAFGELPGVREQVQADRLGQPVQVLAGAHPGVLQDGAPGGIARGGMREPRPVPGGPLLQGVPPGAGPPGAVAGPAQHGAGDGGRVADEQHPVGFWQGVGELVEFQQVLVVLVAVAGGPRVRLSHQPSAQRGRVGDASRGHLGGGGAQDLLDGPQPLFAVPAVGRPAVQGVQDLIRAQMPTLHVRLGAPAVQEVGQLAVDGEDAAGGGEGLVEHVGERGGARALRAEQYDRCGRGSHEVSRTSAGSLSHQSRSRCMHSTLAAKPSREKSSPQGRSRLAGDRTRP